jgi:hypothetical protein
VPARLRLSRQLRRLPPAALKPPQLVTKRQFAGPASPTRCPPFAVVVLRAVLDAQGDALRGGFVRVLHVCRFQYLPGYVRRRQGCSAVLSAPSALL